MSFPHSPSGCGRKLSELVASTFPLPGCDGANNSSPLLPFGSQVSSPLGRGGMTLSSPSLPPQNPQGPHPAQLGGNRRPWKCWSQLFRHRAAPSWPPEKCRSWVSSWGKERTGSLGAPMAGLGASSAPCWDKWGPPISLGGLPIPHRAPGGIQPNLCHTLWPA